MKYLNQFSTLLHSVSVYLGYLCVHVLRTRHKNARGTLSGTIAGTEIESFVFEQIDLD